MVGIEYGNTAVDQIVRYVEGRDFETAGSIIEYKTITVGEEVALLVGENWYIYAAPRDPICDLHKLTNFLSQQKLPPGAVIKLVEESDPNAFLIPEIRIVSKGRRVIFCGEIDQKPDPKILEANNITPPEMLESAELQHTYDVTGRFYPHILLARRALENHRAAGRRYGVIDDLVNGWVYKWQLENIEQGQDPFTKPQSPWERFVRASYNAAYSFINR